jgi:hypothetical protein
VNTVEAVAAAAGMGVRWAGITEVTGEVAADFYNGRDYR